MAWTTPGTAVTGAVLTASFWNTHVRNNMRETAPAKVTTEGDILVATGANELKRLPALTSADILKLAYGGLGIDLSGVTAGQIIQGAAGGGAFELVAAAKGIEIIGSGNFDITAANSFATQANSADIDLPAAASATEVWGVVATATGDPMYGLFIGARLVGGHDVTGVTNSNYGTSSVPSGVAIIVAGNPTASTQIRLGKTSGNKLLVATNSPSQDPMPLVLFRFPV